MINKLFLGIFSGLLLSFSAAADEKQVIIQQLTDFLTYNHKLSQHQSFWADELVYTSSSGKRFGKAKILVGVQAEENAHQRSTAPSYAAQQVDVRLYGTTAVLAFKLVVSRPSEAEQCYLNTGTLIKRDGRWQVIAWQATRMSQ